MNYVKGVFPANGDQSTYLQGELSKIQAALNGGTTGSSGSSGSGGGDASTMRLSATPGVAVTSTDNVSVTQINGVIVGGNTFSLYDGTGFRSYTIATEPALTLDATRHTASKCFSVFAYFDGSIVRLGSGPVWTGTAPNETPGVGAGTSETEVFQGRIVNKYDITLRASGVTTVVGARRARLVGGFATTAIAGQTEDSLAKRLISSVVVAPRAMKRVEATDSWNGAPTNAWRYANGSSLNQLEFFQITGVYPVQATVNALVQNNTGTPRTAGTGIGLDATVPYLTSLKDNMAVDNTKGWPQKAWFNDYVPIGRHVLTWLEVSGTADTRTWYGDAGSDQNFQTGISGTVIN